MNKLPSFLILLFILISVGRGNAQVQWQVLGPTTWKRGTGTPVTEVLTLSALGRTATLKLINGNNEDSSVEKVSSSIVTLNGTVIFSPSDFNQRVNAVEKNITLREGQNNLEVLLSGKPRGQITIKITQEVEVITPQIALLQTANALRVGNMPLALEGFRPDDKRRDLLLALDYGQRNELAKVLTNAQLVREAGNMRFYKYCWTDETGERFVKINMAKDPDGKWIITSW